MECFFFSIQSQSLAEGPGVARGTAKKCFKKCLILFNLYHPQATYECLQKNLSSFESAIWRALGINIYMNVLFYYINIF